MKAVLKEITIILLLCLAICLVLAVIFYNYIPVNKVIPSNVEAYQTSETIKNEVNEEIVEYPKQNIVFEITDSDLTLYKQTKSYVPGKSNPFKDLGSGTSNSENNTNIENGNSDNSNTTGNVSNNGNTNSTQNYFKDTDLK